MTNEQNVFDSQALCEPLEEYKQHYRQLHEKNTIELFDSLTQKSGVDVAQNKSTITDLNVERAKKAQTEKKIGKQRFLRGTAIFFLIVAIAAFIYGIVVAIEAFEGLHIVIIAGGILIATLCILLLTKIKPILKALNEKLQAEEKKIEELTTLAWQQMSPLNALLVPEWRNKLFMKTLPLFELDKFFDSKRFDYFVNKFGLGNNNDINRSTLFVQSGEIEGNPFLICNDLTHELGVRTYSGSITIHWTTTSFQDGKTVTQHHSQVLTAEVTKPCPYYYEVPYVVYGNEAAPDLIFSRMDSDAENMTQKQIDKEVDRKIKKLNKKAEKSIAQGDSYTVLGNSEFEVLFGATNRNHEVQFRLLFTPLAQKNLLCLMKDKVNGFGDDFAFFKNKMINRVYPEQLKRIELSIPDNFFHNYDYEAIKAKFIHHNNAYMRHLYFAFAPLMSIPMYRQQRPHEYIYKDLYDSYVSYYAHEFVANSFGEDYFMSPFSQTRNILKTNVVRSENSRDTVSVTAFGYSIEHRVDYINQLGRDGKVHTIPVHWDEYIPVMESKYLDIDVFDNEQALLDSPTYRQFFKDNPQGTAALRRVGIFLASLHSNNAKR